MGGAWCVMRSERGPNWEGLGPLQERAQSTLPFWLISDRPTLAAFVTSWFRVWEGETFAQAEGHHFR